MQNIFFAEIGITLNDLLYNSLRPIFLYFFLLVEQLHEIPMRAVLGDDVVIVLCFVGIVELYNVGMI